MKSVYIIGSLRNPEVPCVANKLREGDYEVFDNWFTGGPGADDAWRDYERGRGHTYQQALDNHSAKQIYGLDFFHLNRCHAAVLVLPAGRSGHLEAGFVSGLGKPVFMLLDKDGEPERLDVMTQFLHGVYDSTETMQTAIDEYAWPKLPDLPFLTVLDALWLAGVMEGDGTFCLTSGTMPRALLQMTDLDTIEHAARIFGSKVWKHPKTSSGKQVWACGRSGLTAIEWMRILMPYMSLRRQEQIRATAAAWVDSRKYRTQDAGWWLRAFNLKKS